jgi:hypothetical protein
VYAEAANSFLPTLSPKRKRNRKLPHSA